ncbi:MAG: hypothetical protein ROZ09_02460 [Thiobacillus sp.]|uniref:hypothetical protein n=1 Tax=Thiobacillus sp. TaxID=924 RepID=UPI002895B246|nr:hypothetical protein [Thiobacillus sp.]MDT3705659.1 hypothetical protein [Thiobacillus sp.]
MAQFVGCLAAMRLGVAEFLLQGLQASLKRFEFGLPAIGLAGANAQGRTQHQQDEKMSEIHPLSLP